MASSGIWYAPLLEQLDDLETRFYVGKVDGEIIANIMIVEHGHIGILGHVFTTPTQRRKGACKAVMGFQMEDFRQRDGEALYLGTGYNSHPYYIYNSFGFESVFPGSGFMKYRTVEDFDDRYFAGSPVHAKDVVWNDWAKMTALTGIVEGDYLRSIAFGIYGPANFEGGFLGIQAIIGKWGYLPRRKAAGIGRRGNCWRGNSLLGYTLATRHSGVRRFRSSKLLCLSIGSA